MPWKECSVMDERAQVARRRADGELCSEFGIPARQATKSLIPTRNVAFRGLPIGAGVPIAMPINFTLIAALDLGKEL